MLSLEDVTDTVRVITMCNPSYDDPITCNPDSGWCNPDLCSPQDAPSGNCGPDYGDCNPD